MTARTLILGTAGHIDHGKTTLLRALTGIECDRLPEEKQRGITIDIGFANLDLGDYQLGIVDVPGHERFIKNMLAGAVGIDIALLVIAADDSVMPQTREHLGILQLLGIEHGVVAITKCDRVDATWLDLVEDDIRLLLADTFMKDAPLLRISVPAEGEASGIEELRAAIRTVCEQVSQSTDSGFFRLPIDRTFSVQGLGTVVTGTVWSGCVSTGDTVEWLPSGKKLTVRGIQNHGKPTEKAERGQRAAINLGGVHHSEILRGQELASPGYLSESKVLTVDLHLLADSPWAMKHRSRQRLFIGTQEIMVTVALFKGTQIEPGQNGLAQLHCAQPTIALGYQPFVLRAESPLVTIGGGRVLLPQAGRISRRQTRRIDHLEALNAVRPEERAAIALYFYGLWPWSELDLCRDTAISLERAKYVVAELEASGVVVDISEEMRLPFHVHREALAEAEERIVQHFTRFHLQSPLRSAVPRDRIALACQASHDAQVTNALVDRLIARGVLRSEKNGVGLASFSPQLTTAQQELYSQVQAAWREGGLKPPQPTELLETLSVEEIELRQILEYCTDRGDLVFLAPGIYLDREVEAEMRTRLESELRKPEGLSVSQIREFLGTTRKFAVPICEYLDKIGFTTRQGNLRRLA